MGGALSETLLTALVVTAAMMAAVTAAAATTAATEVAILTPAAEVSATATAAVSATAAAMMAAIDHINLKSALTKLWATAKAQFSSIVCIAWKVTEQEHLNAKADFPF
jgi:hypothetical protein